MDFEGEGDKMLDKIIEFLKENKASEELIKSAESLTTVNLESVKGFLEKDEAGKKYLQSQKDAAVTKGIETFKEKTMPNLIEEQIKSKFPEETAEQKRMRELETKQQKLEAEIKRKDMLNKAINYATEKKLPIKFVDRFLGDDENSTIANIDSFGEIYSEAVSKAVEAKFKESGRDAPPGDGHGGNGQKVYKTFDEWKQDNAI